MAVWWNLDAQRAGDREAMRGYVAAGGIANDVLRGWVSGLLDLVDELGERALKDREAKRVAQARADLACEEPPDGCECVGCSLARECGGVV